MTQSEYEQKRAECWEEFCRANPSHNKSIFARKVFDFAFDRAYALGKETVTITQEDIDRAAVEYAASLSECGVYDKETPATKEDMEYAFKAGTNFALGKKFGNPELSVAEETVISGWVTKDEDGHLFMYSTKPERDEALQVWIGRYADFDLRNYLFPDLTWGSDPIGCEITIKRKKNG